MAVAVVRAAYAVAAAAALASNHGIHSRTRGLAKSATASIRSNLPLGGERGLAWRPQRAIVVNDGGEQRCGRRVGWRLVRGPRLLALAVCHCRERR